MNASTCSSPLDDVFEIYNPLSPSSSESKALLTDEDWWREEKARTQWIRFDDARVPQGSLDDQLHRVHDKLPCRRPVQVGERLVALTRVAPQDTIYLSFEKGAEIEVVQTDPPGYAQGVIKGKTDGRVGLVETRYVRRPRSSMVGLTPMDSSKLIDRKNSTLLPQRPPQLTHTMSDVSTRFRFSPPPCNNSDYMNTEVVGQIWYQGSIERNEAAEKLKGSPNGTFLVRFSPNRGKFAISISYNQEVKHTIVEYQEMMYYLDEGIQFNSVVELVNYYKDHNLSESFQALDTSLRQPYRQTKELRVIHDFERKEERFLEIRKGDILTLVDTIGEDRGWWKGRIGQRVGFFPLSYVEEMDGNGSVKSL